MFVKADKIFDITARTYDRTEEKRFLKNHLTMIRYTRKYLRGGDTVLDIGCATGSKALEFSKIVKRIAAIDISSKMIEAAKKKAKERNIRNADFIQATLFDKRLKRRSFNVITAFNVIHLIEEPGRGLKRIYDLLKPGGLFISCTPCMRERMSFLTSLQFFPFRVLIKAGLFPPLTGFKFQELKNLVLENKFQIIADETYFYQLSGYYAAARKKR